MDGGVVTSRTSDGGSSSRNRHCTGVCDPELPQGIAGGFAETLVQF